MLKFSRENTWIFHKWVWNTVYIVLISFHIENIFFSLFYVKFQRRMVLMETHATSLAYITVWLWQFGKDLVQTTPIQTDNDIFAQGKGQKREKNYLICSLAGCVSCNSYFNHDCWECFQEFFFFFLHRLMHSTLYHLPCTTAPSYHRQELENNFWSDCNGRFSRNRKSVGTIVEEKPASKTIITTGTAISYLYEFFSTKL